MPALGDGERLQKVLATRGYGSRRVCEELIAEGRVTVNGEVAVLGRRIDADADVVEVDGHLVPVRPGLVHYLLNKPAGVVTTAHDTHGRPTVVDLVPGEPRVFPVGRLDADTEGLLLLTNDGDLAHRLTHPSFGVDKEYLAHVAGEPSAGDPAPAASGRRPRRRSDGPGQGVTAHTGRCCASPSTRAATARCAGCARPWGTRSNASSGCGSVRSATSD